MEHERYRFGGDRHRADCKAAAETIGGEEDVSKYHKFAWAWSYGNDTTITISFAGNGFSMTGGDRGASGEEIHRP